MPSLNDEPEERVIGVKIKIRKRKKHAKVRSAIGIVVASSLLSLSPEQLAISLRAVASKEPWNLQHKGVVNGKIQA